MRPQIMKIVATHSHFNGLEFLLMRKPELWKRLQLTIAGGDINEIEHSLRDVIVNEERVDLSVQTMHDNKTDALARQYLRYVRDEIDVGIDVCEGELYNIIRNGRGVPAVPLVMIGVAP
jgi:hypothetical protein